MADGAGLRWAGEPFVVADGADVPRTLVVARPDPPVRLRETLVLGRSGEVGGRLRTRTDLRVAGVEVWREDKSWTRPGSATSRDCSAVTG